MEHLQREAAGAVGNDERGRSARGIALARKRRFDGRSQLHLRRSTTLVLRTFFAERVAPSREWQPWSDGRIQQDACRSDGECAADAASAMSKLRIPVMPALSSHPLIGR